MISHRLWRTRFGSDPGIIDKTIDLGGYPVRVVGVAPASFVFPGLDPDVFRPTAFSRAQLGQVSFRRAHWLGAIGRLRPGVTPAQADAALQVVVKRLQREYPATNTNMGAGFTPLHRFLMGDVRDRLLALQAAVALLLLIACANVGNLLLVRAADRERESVVRLALGAGRGRLVRQAFTESLVLAALGGTAGVAVGWAGTRVLAAMQPEGMLPVGNIGINARRAPLRSWDRPCQRIALRNRAGDLDPAARACGRPEGRRAWRHRIRDCVAGARDSRWRSWRSRSC